MESCLLSILGTVLVNNVVLVKFLGLRERLSPAQVPGAFAGAPIGFVTAGPPALAFMGFADLTAD